MFEGFVCEYELYDIEWKTEKSDDEFGSSHESKKIIKGFMYGSNDLKIEQNSIDAKPNITYCVSEPKVNIGDRLNDMIVTSVFPILDFSGVSFYVCNTEWGTVHGTY